MLTFEQNFKAMEIYITTFELESKKLDPNSFQEGFQKTFSRAELMLHHPQVARLDFKTRKPEDKEKTLEKVLIKAKDAVTAVAKKLGESAHEIENLSEMEIEFGIGFSQKLDLWLFGAGSDQTLKVKLKLTKPKPKDELD